MTRYVLVIYIVQSHLCYIGQLYVLSEINCYLHWHRVYKCQLLHPWHN